MQKYYTEDFLTKKQVLNQGVLPQYYVEGNHEAIIAPETFELVQQELSKRHGHITHAVYPSDPDPERPDASGDHG